MDLEGQPARDACQRARRRTLNEDGRFSHSYLVRSYNGHYLGLSIRRREFDSPTHRQIPLLFSLKWRLISDRDPVAEDRKCRAGNYPS